MKNKRIIKNNYRFQEIIGSKKSTKNQSLVIYFLKNNEKFNYGISVGKKLGNAVLRNKVKRQIRCIVQEFLKTGYDKQYDVVIIARKPFLDKSFKHNTDSLVDLLSKLN